MKRIAGFLVLSSLAVGCDQKPSKDNAPGAEPNRLLPASAVEKPQEVGFPAPAESEKTLPSDSPMAAGTAKAALEHSANSQETKTAVPKPAETSDSPKQALASGKVVSGEGFKLQMQTQSPQVVGKPGTLLVTLTADSPFKCNDKYPYKFKFEPIDGVSFPNETVRGMKVGKKTSTMSVPFSPQHSGKQSVSGDLSFSVCTDDKCLVEKQRLSVSFDVVDAS